MCAQVYVSVQFILTLNKKTNAWKRLQYKQIPVPSCNPYE